MERKVKTRQVVALPQKSGFTVGPSQYHLAVAGGCMRSKLSKSSGSTSYPPATARWYCLCPSQVLTFEAKPIANSLLHSKNFNAILRSLRPRQISLRELFRRSYI